jgi:hypothetical protein
MQIAGITEHPVESIDAAMADLRNSGVDINVSAIDTYIG